jgi:hypothetical protein
MAEATCTLARYSPDFWVTKLNPYTEVYKNIQGILFYRRPLAFVAVIFVVETLFYMIGSSELSFLSVASLFLALYYALQLAYFKFGGAFVKTCFPPIQEGSPPESNRIYPLLPFCQRLSHISSTIVDALEDVCNANKAGSVKSLIGTSGVFALLFLFFAVVGTFWPIFVIVHLVLLAPGIVMHPKVFPYTEPYILKFAKAIKCPYCQAKTD